MPKIAWIFKREEDSDWELSMIDPKEFYWYYEVRKIVYFLISDDS
jgi:hypothetical protein